jgi:hypothetical protein
MPGDWKRGDGCDAIDNNRSSQKLTMTLPKPSKRRIRNLERLMEVRGERAQARAADDAQAWFEQMCLARGSEQRRDGIQRRCKRKVGMRRRVHERVSHRS